MKKVYFNSERCLGCHSCEFVCAVEHSRSKDPGQAHLEEERTPSRRKVRLVEGACLTVGCRHCDPTACVEACMAGAMTKDAQSGEVSCNTDKCVACWMCVMVCPFGAVRPGKLFTIKCDMCVDREAPACVEACPTRALFEATAEEFKGLVRTRKAASKPTEKAGLKT